MTGAKNTIFCQITLTVRHNNSVTFRRYLLNFFRFVFHTFPPSAGGGYTRVVGVYVNGSKNISTGGASNFPRIRSRKQQENREGLVWVTEERVHPSRQFAAEEIIEFPVDGRKSKKGSDSRYKMYLN